MMYSFVCLIFLSALILVQCQEFQHKEIGPHGVQIIPNCNAERIRILENLMNASLMPRERLVALIPEPGYEYKPHTVTVKRCNGLCPGRWSPMPSDTQLKKFSVNRHEEGKIMKKDCVAVEVLEHMRCKCMCMHSEKDCTPSQDWIPASCSCQCKDRETKRFQCKTQVGMEWYDDDCSCACTQEIMECPSGQKWNKKDCRCEPK